MTFDTQQQLSTVICPYKYMQRHYSEGCLVSLEKTCAIEANKKQVPLKKYSLKIRIDSVNQILKNKKKLHKPGT